MPDEMLQLPMVNSVLERHKGSAGALLPILHEIQAGIGYIPDAAIPEIAHALNQSQAEVRGVISFYHDFRTAPPARRAVA
jgi:formate dehydrogenase subunit gamma